MGTEKSARRGLRVNIFSLDVELENSCVHPCWSEAEVLYYLICFIATYVFIRVSRLECPKSGFLGQPDAVHPDFIKTRKFLMNAKSAR